MIASRKIIAALVESKNIRKQGGVSNLNQRILNALQPSLRQYVAKLQAKDEELLFGLRSQAGLSLFKSQERALNSLVSLFRNLSPHHANLKRCVFYIADYRRDETEAASETDDPPPSERPSRYTIELASGVFENHADDPDIRARFERIRAVIRSRRASAP